MNLYDRYLVRRFCGYIFRACFALVGLYILIDLLTNRIERIDRYDVPVGAVLEYYALQIPELLFQYHILAIAMLSAGVMIFGGLAERHEVVSMLAGGVSLRRLARPVIALGVVLAIAALAFAEFAGVHATARHELIDQTYFRRGSEDAQQTRSWNNLGEQGWTCNVLSFNRLALTGQDVYLHLNRPDRIEEIRADRIYWDPQLEQWLLEDGRRFRFDPSREWEGVSSRITQEPAPFQTPPDQLFALERPANTKPVWTLATDIARAERLRVPTQRAKVAFHEKLAAPFIGAIMLLLAVPFAMRVRRGGLAIGFGLSAALAMAYLLVHFGATGLGNLGILPAPIAVWFANAVFLGLGTHLFIRTPT